MNVSEYSFVEFTEVPKMIERMLDGTFGDEITAKLCSQGAALFAKKEDFIRLFLQNLFVIEGEEARNTGLCRKIPAVLLNQISIGYIAYKKPGTPSEKQAERMEKLFNEAIGYCSITDHSFNKITNLIESSLKNLPKEKFRDLAFSKVTKNPDLAILFAFKSNDKDIIARVIEGIAINDAEKAKELLLGFKITNNELFTYCYDNLGEILRENVGINKASF